MLLPVAPLRPRLPKLVGSMMLGTLLGLGLPAGAADGTGRSFMFAFQNNQPDQHPGDHAWLRLYIAAPDGASGTVRVPGLGFSQAIGVAPGALAQVELPLAAKALPDNGTADLGVQVTLNAPAIVYGMNRLRASTDAFLALPEDALGRDYRVLAYRSTNGRSQVAVTAIADGTEVLIHPSGAVRGLTTGEPLRLRLNRGQVYSLVGATAAVDLTGTRIGASAPVAVQAGAECANVPPNAGTCDHLVEMLPPLSAWGRRFLTLPLATRQRGDLLRILADQDGTEVRIDGTPVATLAAGAVWERMQRTPALIETSAPVLIGQYAVGTSVDRVVSDPFMVLIPPMEQYLDRYLFATPESGFRANFVNVICPTTALPTLQLDDAPVDAARFAPIGDGTWRAAALPLTPGSHRLRAGSPFGITIYGFDQADSYGYPGGMGLAQINRDVVPALPAPVPPAPPPARLGAQAPVDLGTLARNGEQQTSWAPVLLNANGPVSVGLAMAPLGQGVRLEINTGAGWQRLDGERLTPTWLPDGPPWSLRARAGRCLGALPADGPPLRLTLPGGGADVEVPIRMTSEPTPWWVCLLPWLIALAALVTGGFIVWGLLSPARFPRQLGVQLADEEDVEQGFFLLLRAQPGTGSGFYRAARAWVRADYRVCGQAAAGVARLRAGHGLVHIMPARGALVQWQTAAGDWEGLPVQEIPARLGTLYRSEAGGLYFMLRNR